MEVHSAFNDTKADQACGIALLPLNTSVKGPAFKTEDKDIVDEAL